MTPDNLSIYEAYEAEQERQERIRRRNAIEWGDDWDDLEFQDVPDDYGNHKELY
jgi:hypothetical protein